MRVMKKYQAATVPEYHMYIDGEWVNSSNEDRLEVRNPYDNSLYAFVQNGTREDVKKSIDSAYSAKERWEDTPANDRANYLYRLIDLVAANKNELIDIIINESGSTYKKASAELSATLRAATTAAKEARRVTGETISSDTSKISFTMRRPAGVVTAITPHNYPLLIPMKKALHALAVGNTMVLKPASPTPISQLKVAEFFDTLGLPAGVFNIVTGSPTSIGDELITNSKVAHVSFTGAYKTGKYIAKKAAASLKKVTLELGGSDPLIILKDAPLDYAVNAAIFGGFFHQGQVCISAKRIIIEDALAPAFIEKFVKRAKMLVVGDPYNHDTDIGPIATKAQLRTIRAQVEDAVAKGAALLCGGTYRGQLYSPTVINDVTPDMRIYKEEVFGPVRPVISVADEREAITIANDTIYGLSSGIITNNVSKALRLAKKLECGMVHINDSPLHFDSHAPFGGVKGSGIGREGGKYSTDDLTELKWITIQCGTRSFLL